MIPKDMIGQCFPIWKGIDLSTCSNTLQSESAPTEPWSADFLMSEHHPRNRMKIVNVKNHSAFPHLLSQYSK